MKQKILVAVTGMTPQIVTETVYALHKNHNWLPEKIIVLTTLSGKKQIVQQLLGEKGYFNRLREDYRLPEIAFSADTIQVIAENGAELDDIRTAEQNNAAADLIVQTIYDLCQDDNTELHVSIAGGRKTMGFYVGYALSLFGRVQDKMSHVLVEQDFELNREFFYPPKNPHILNTGSGMKDASQAEVMLAEIPFVRMTQNQLQFVFDKNKNEKGEEKTSMTFSKAVECTQKILSGGMKLTLNVATCEVMIGDVAKFDLQAKDFCVYATIALRKKMGKLTEFSDNGATEFAHDYMSFYQHFDKELKSYSENYPHNQSGWQELLKVKTDDLSFREKEKVGVKGKRLKSTPKIESDLNVAKSHIAKELKKHLGAFGMRFEVVSMGENEAKVYDLNIDRHLIEIIE